MVWDRLGSPNRTTRQKGGDRTMRPLQKLKFVTQDFTPSTASHVVFSLEQRPSWKGSCALSWSGVGRYLIEPVPREHGLRKTFHYIHRSCRL